LATPFNGNNNGLLPIWVRAVTMVGIPGALAFYLAWFLVASVSGDLRRLYDTQGLLAAYLAQICRNTASGELGRLECDRINVPPR
jgi:hypothetical protein